MSFKDLNLLTVAIISYLLCAVSIKTASVNQDSCIFYISLSNFYNKIIDLIQPYRNQLYCQLTKKYINNAPHHIQRHVSGKRFSRALEKRKV